jgi:hypothetical protein
MMLSGDMGGPGVMANPWAPGAGTVAMTNKPVPNSGRPGTMKPIISPWPMSMNTFAVPGQRVNAKPGYSMRSGGYGGSIPSMARHPGGRSRPGPGRSR